MCIARGGSARQANVFRTPPRQGESHVRRRGPLLERWCGSCGVWGSNATVQHNNAESAKLISTDSQTQVSNITQPTVQSTGVPNTTLTSASDDSINMDAASADDDSIPPLLLNFI